ncbi:MAG: hypothetical protein Unbinned5434contig1000_34 [Prokaryotic dsDNA virus sp.]|jgi:hypothetical protein|nr:MAG: hypothetical protein Unbinned5434contig1000_34 [Prokaryotic dsDNA virus sp.]|tara:strand:- start:504 stop:1781 length:1278 start_codon:yes stop_codon:yes gene_type:complete
MSTINDAKIILIPSGYKSEKLYCVKPTNGDGDFTFARTSQATRVNEGGYIETIQTNIPRIDYFNGSCPTFLKERQSTNRQTYSQELDNSAWTKQADLTVTANQIISPSNELNADKIQRGSTINTNNYVFDQVNKSSASQLNIAVSVFVKQGEGDFFSMRAQGNYSTGRVDFIYQFSTNTITANAAGTDATLLSTKSENYGNGWYRLSLVFNSDAVGTNTIYFSPRATSGNIDSSDTSSSAFVYLWGVQVEENDFSTSYVPTTSAMVSRNLETCDASGNSSIFNDSEGVLFAHIAALHDDQTRRDIAISDGTSNQFVRMHFLNSQSNKMRFQVKNVTMSVNINLTLTDITNFNKIAFSYKENDCKVYINGSLVHTDPVATMPSGLNTLAFDDGFSANTGQFEGHCKDLRYYDTALTHQQLIELTTL